MSVPTPAGDAPAADPAQTTPAVTSNAPAAEESISLDEARKLRRESQALRERLKTFETADSERQAATLSKEEQLSKAMTAAEKRADQAEARAQQVEASLLIERAAVKAGIDPDLASSLIKVDDVDRDTAGKFSNADKAVAALLKKWPHLAAQTINGSAANPARGASVTPITRADLKNMSPDEINRRRAAGELDALLASG